MQLFVSNGLRLVCRLKQVHLYSIFIPSAMSQSASAGVELSRVVTVLEEFAPKRLAEAWDNTGLLVEPYTPRKITKILLTNDLTEDVIFECRQIGAEIIISYHPPIFAALKSVVSTSWKEKIVAQLLEYRLALYSPHTSWDSVVGGVNDWLAACLPIEESKPLSAGESPDVGAGRFVTLKQAITLKEAIERIKRHVNLPHLRLGKGRGCDLDQVIKTVALCAGSGASVLKNASADLYLTGEMLHHDVLDANEKSISVILTNHSDSERGFLKVFAPKLKSMLNENVDVVVSKVDKDPLETV